MDNNKKDIKTLIMTSCNRIKQVILSMTINSFIIKDKFYFVILDCSTPKLSADEAIKIHRREDPYNKVNEDNYCSDITLFDNHIQYIKNSFIDYKIIHINPRIEKQKGESSMIALGLMMASLNGNNEYNGENYTLKLGGVCVLKEDILSNLDILLQGKDILTYHRTNIGGYERSTRVFGCRTKPFLSALIEEGWAGWINDYAFIEQKFPMIIEKRMKDKIQYTENDETNIIVDEGRGYVGADLRWRIENVINKYNIPKEIPIINEFLNGGIW